MDADHTRDDLTDAPIPQLVSLAGLVVTRVWTKQASEQHGMSAAGVSALLMITFGTNRAGGEAATPGRASHAELARRMWVNPATLTGIVDTLVKAGYVQRERDCGDRRIVWLTPTEAGRQRARQIGKQVHEAFGSMIRIDDPTHEKIIRGFLIDLVATYRDKEFIDVCDRRRDRRRSRSARQEIPET